MVDNIDKPIGFATEQNEAISQMVDMEIVENSVENVQMMEDGSAVIGEQSSMVETGFDMNLAEVIDENELGSISNDLFESFETDKSSRKEWEETYKKGLDLLGFKYQERSQPFQGASAVTHPMLSEAITQFQAQAYKELLPPGGPVNTQIIGKVDRQREEQSHSDRCSCWLERLVVVDACCQEPLAATRSVSILVRAIALNRVYFHDRHYRIRWVFLPIDLLEHVVEDESLLLLPERFDPLPPVISHQCLKEVLRHLCCQVSNMYFFACFYHSEYSKNPLLHQSASPLLIPGVIRYRLLART